MTVSMSVIEHIMWTSAFMLCLTFAVRPIGTVDFIIRKFSTLDGWLSVLFCIVIPSPLAFLAVFGMQSH